MNDTNLAALKKKLEGLGFKDRLHTALETQIKSGAPEFILQDSVVYNKREMSTELSFKAGKQNEMYFLNSFTASLRNEPDKQHTFYLDRGRGITNKEAFNLLEGRAVNKLLTNKEGQEYNAWVQLDFSKKDDRGHYVVNRYHENYNFDIRKEVDGLVLKPLTQEEDARLLASLKKGNLQTVTFLKNGEQVSLQVAANPKQRTIDLYDENGVKLGNTAKLDYMDIPDPSARKVAEPQPGLNKESNAPAVKEVTKEAKKSTGQTGENKPGDISSPLLKKKNAKPNHGQRI